MCIAPVSIKQTVDGQIVNLAVDCGRCFECAKRRRDEWSIRLQMEADSSYYNYFLTLTYDDSNLTYSQPHADVIADDSYLVGRYPTLIKRHVQLYIKRLRKSLTGCKIRYFATGEYGGHTLRPHYHIIIFSSKAIDPQVFSDSWSVGFVSIGTVTGAALTYVAKYVAVQDERDLFTKMNVLQPFALMSRRPGIGASYFTSNRISYHEDYPEDRYFIVIDGVKRRLPRYYARKLVDARTRQAIGEKFSNQRRILEESEIEILGSKYFEDKLISQRLKQATFNRNKKLKL